VGSGDRRAEAVQDIAEGREISERNGGGWEPEPERIGERGWKGNSWGVDYARQEVGWGRAGAAVPYDEQRVYYISEELWGPGKYSTERQKKLPVKLMVHR